MILFNLMQSSVHSVRNLAVSLAVIGNITIIINKIILENISKLYLYLLVFNMCSIKIS